jgi:hypothetical protein
MNSGFPRTLATSVTAKEAPPRRGLESWPACRKPDIRLQKAEASSIPAEDRFDTLVSTFPLHDPLHEMRNRIDYP